MGNEPKAGVPGWLKIATAVVALLAGVLVLVVRYYEIQKARAEAARAQAELQQRPPAGEKEPPALRPPGPQAAPQPAGPKVPAAGPPGKAAPPAAKAPGPPARELAAFAGDWRCVREVSFGKEASADELVARSRRLTITGDQFVMTRVINNVFGRYEGKLTVDPAPSPKQFDFAGRGPNGNPVQWSGIYALTGDDLTVAYVYQEPGRMLPRPAEFTSAPGSPVLLLEYRRAR